MPPPLFSITAIINTPVRHAGSGAPPGWWLLRDAGESLAGRTGQRARWRSCLHCSKSETLPPGCLMPPPHPATWDKLAEPSSPLPGTAILPRPRASLGARVPTVKTLWLGAPASTSGPWETVEPACELFLLATQMYFFYLVVNRTSVCTSNNSKTDINCPPPATGRSF